MAQPLLFRADDGYTLVTLARSETYSDTGGVKPVIGALAVEQANEFGMSDGMGLG